MDHWKEFEGLYVQVEHAPSCWDDAHPTYAKVSGSGLLFYSQNQWFGSTVLCDDTNNVHFASPQDTDAQDPYEVPAASWQELKDDMSSFQTNGGLTVEGRLKLLYCTVIITHLLIFTEYYDNGVYR